MHVFVHVCVRACESVCVSLSLSVSVYIGLGGVGGWGRQKYVFVYQLIKLIVTSLTGRCWNSIPNELIFVMMTLEYRVLWDSYTRPANPDDGDDG